MDDITLVEGASAPGIPREERGVDNAAANLQNMKKYWEGPAVHKVKNRLRINEERDDIINKIVNNQVNKNK